MIPVDTIEILGWILQCLWQTAAPSEPQNILLQPVGCNTLQVQWTHPREANGQIAVYRAQTTIGNYFCEVYGITFRMCQMHSIPADTDVEVFVFACTYPNFNGQGGGCGPASPTVRTRMWNGGVLWVIKLFLLLPYSYICSHWGRIPGKKSRSGPNRRRFV